MSSDHRAARARLDESVARLGVELPGPMAGFDRLRGAAIADGALSASARELIALAIAVHAGSAESVTYHVDDAVRLGATREEIVEAIGVALMMGGGLAVIHGAWALEALDQMTRRAAGKWP